MSFSATEYIRFPFYGEHRSSSRTSEYYSHMQGRWISAAEINVETRRWSSNKPQQTSQRYVVLNYFLCRCKAKNYSRFILQDIKNLSLLCTFLDILYFSVNLTRRSDILREFFRDKRVISCKRMILHEQFQSTS